MKYKKSLLLVYVLIFVLYRPTTIQADVYLDKWNGLQKLKQVASCESWGTPEKEPRQFDDNGNVLVGYPNKDDKGMFQINKKVWGKKAKELGFDIYTEQGNFEMGKWIYEHRGLQDWKYSRHCWDKNI